MKTLQNGRPVAAILSDLASLGPFLPCSIRKGGVQRHRNKAGELVEYKAQPRLNFRIGGKPVDKRIPFEQEAEARDMIGNYKRFKALVRELERARLREWLDGSKKTPDSPVRGRSVLLAHGRGPRRTDRQGGGREDPQGCAGGRAGDACGGLPGAALGSGGG